MLYLETKSIKSGCHLSGALKEGGGLVGIIKMALMGWMSPYGGLPSAISRAVIPEEKDQTLSNKLMFENTQQPTNVWKHFSNKLMFENTSATN